MKFASHLTLLMAINFLAHADWKQWRGPSGQGHAKAKLPVKWSETENVTWRTSIPGKGWSSPVIEDNQIVMGYPAVQFKEFIKNWKK